MSLENIIRAWKDTDFRNSLNEQERALLPEHPAGLLELTDAQLEEVAGGRYPASKWCSEYCSYYAGCE